MMSKTNNLKQVKYCVYSRVCNYVRDQVENQMDDQVWIQARFQVVSHVWDQVESVVSCEVWRYDLMESGAELDGRTGNRQ